MIYCRQTIEAHLNKSSYRGKLTQALWCERVECRSCYLGREATAGNRDKIPFAVAEMRSAILLFHVSREGQGSVKVADTMCTAVFIFPLAENMPVQETPPCVPPAFIVYQYDIEEKHP